MAKRKANNIVQMNTGKAKTKERAGMDFILLFTILVLTVIGLSMLFSASSAANMTSGNVYAPIIKQSSLAAAGLAAMLMLSLCDYNKVRPYLQMLYLVSAIVMFIVPIVGMASHGATRQIDLKIISFQPSEFSKYLLIMWLADRFTRIKKGEIKMWPEVLFELLIIGIPTVECVVLQSHLSAGVIHAAVGFVMMLSAGCELKKLIPIGICSGALMLAAIFLTGYRTDRLLSLLNKGAADSQGRDWQSIQSVYAVGSGGLFGRGLGNSVQKYSYLPEAENDYIFAIVAEELGFIGCLLIIFLYCVLIWRGIMIAVNCKDSFGTYLAFGITVLIGLQMLINMGVVLQLLPSTGMQLPLFSSGGTSLIITLMGFGILLSISRNGRKK